MNIEEIELRHYTITIKPTLNSLKGDMTALGRAYLDVLNYVNGETVEQSIEKQGTKSCHIHAMIRCPFIKDKTAVSHQVVGYHIHLRIVRKNSLHTVQETWVRYINKEKNDSERFNLVFGNMFPLEDLY